VPEGLNYQAIARDAEGNIMSDARIGIRIELLKGEAGDEVEYRELHHVRTDANGQFSLGKQWEILSLAFSTDFMPIQVSSVKFKNPLLSGDTIFWISESELHDGDQSDIMYSIKIKVINI
jgi:hypothetical protein